MTSIHTKLKELRELRERATGGGRWCEEPPSLLNGDDMFFAAGPSATDVMVKNDQRFINGAANHWLTLIACLEKAIGALEYIRVDIKFDRKEDVIVTKCDEALAEIAEMLEKPK